MFENHIYNKLLAKAGIAGTSTKSKLVKVLIPIAICWLPLVLITIVSGNFWTGHIQNSFITNFDSQARFLICLPVLILSENLISARMGLILGQFKNSGIINKNEYAAFDKIVSGNVSFLKPKWTFIAIILVCYLQVFLVLFYESENTTMLSWQIANTDGKAALSLAGCWSTLVSRPIVFFLLLKWVLHVMVWGWMLRKISLLNLNLFAVHPDLSGGLGFVGYALRFFLPIALAISVVIAGNMIDFILIDGESLNSLKFTILAYFIVITIISTLPLFSFTDKLINAREQSVFENDDFANGLFLELRSQFKKGYDKADAEDLNSVAFSGASDLSAVIDNALNMKFIPFTFKDLIPLWVMTALPFLAVILVEIPINEIFKSLI